MRIGIGYDVHAFCENRKCILGGVEIPYERGLMGHSDADVLVHAIMDALLGAAKLPDIGHLFPDNDPKYEGISSLLLLTKVGELLKEHNYQVQNIDSVIIAEEPKMAPYIENMCENIAKALSVSPALIQVKATTEEHLGFTGEKKGIKAEAVCLLEEI